MEPPKVVFTGERKVKALPLKVMPCGSVVVRVPWKVDVPVALLYTM